MATANQLLDQWRDILEKILQYYANLLYRYSDIITYVVVSRDRNHFMLIQEGWENHRRVHGFIVHAEIRNEKIWIHEEGTGAGKPCVFRPGRNRDTSGFIRL